MDNNIQDLPKESLIEVAESISKEKKVEKKERFPYPTEARLHGSFDGISDTVWLVHVQDRMRKSMITFDSLKQFGRFVPKNSYIGVSMLNKEIGEVIEYDTKDIIKKIRHHKVIVTSKADITLKNISILGDSQPYAYDDINLFLSELIRKRQQIEDTERLIREKEEQRQKELDAHKRGVITKEINKYIEEKRILTLQQEEINNLTKYIREQGKLRFNPILDPVQNRIKTSNLFDGTTIVIDGGPGTGKTTTMIQRLKYLTDDYAINEDAKEYLNKYKLTNTQRQNLFDLIDSGRDWVFFSPSDLLKEYLADAMNKEGLANTKSKVWSWKEFLKKATREQYKFIDPNNANTPFLASRNNEALISQSSNAIDSLTQYYLDTLKQIKQSFPAIEESDTVYRWKSIALRIKQRFDNTDDYDIEQFIRLFNSIEQVYADDCKELLSENRSLLSQISEELFVLVRNSESTFNALTELLPNSAIDQVDDADDEGESVSEDLSDKMISTIKTWFRRYCYCTKNKTVKLTPRQQQIGELLLPLLLNDHKSKISRVGELVLFEQFAKYTRGVVSNMFTGIPTKYKRFRRYIVSHPENGWNTDLLKSLMQKRGGKELHPQEQSLLIGFVNNLVKKTIKIVGTKANHTYIDAYNELARPIIGIDEATDFSKCDIYAMESLLSMDYNSLTLCGDIMQRLTRSGITSWNEINEVLPNMSVVKMRTSYRQSTRLLDVAKSLYFDSIGIEPDYKAYLKSKKVPAPLAFISDDEETKISWIEQRIKEVYSIYKRLPSIAIFLNDARDIRDFVESLENSDFINDTAIEVVDGSSGMLLASSNQIRVYPINVVKGMEFDVVFFHNIDNSSENADLIKRYIYVGVSRAAFFLGATFNEDNKGISKYFEQGKNWKTITEKKEPRAVSEAEPSKISNDTKVDALMSVSEKTVQPKKKYHLLSDGTPRLSETYKKTYKLIAEGLSPEEISLRRSLSAQTIYSHIAFFIEKGYLEVMDFVSQSAYKEILEVANEVGTKKLSAIKELCNDTITYSEIKMVLASIENEEQENVLKKSVDSEWCFIDYVPFIKHSKSFTSHGCRVVLSVSGYYLELYGHYIKLGDYHDGVNFNQGNIWIKGPSKEMVYNIVHNIDGESHVIGKIKEENNEIIYTNTKGEKYIITF